MQSRRLFLFLVILASTIASCDRERSSGPTLAEALRYAGDNRGEMEKVLNHYNKAGDKQKKAAAEFLIRNMPGHISVSGDWKSYSDSRITVFSADIPLEEKISRANIITNGYEPEYTQDIKTLTAEYLIWNIDHSFEMWHNSPYLQHLALMNSVRQCCHISVLKDNLRTTGKNMLRIMEKRYFPKWPRLMNGDMG